MLNETTLKALKTLHYTQNWLSSGILTEDLLLKQIEQFKLGEDSNVEHYRYQTLTIYLRSITLFSDDIIGELLNILESDNDVSMASSGTIALLKTKSLTEKQFNDVADFLIQTFGEWSKKHISKEMECRKKDAS